MPLWLEIVLYKGVLEGYYGTLNGGCYAYDNGQ